MLTLVSLGSIGLALDFLRLENDILVRNGLIPTPALTLLYLASELRFTCKLAVGLNKVIVLFVLTP